MTVSLMGTMKLACNIVGLDKSLTFAVDGEAYKEDSQRREEDRSHNLEDVRHCDCHCVV